MYKAFLVISIKHFIKLKLASYFGNTPNRLAEITITSTIIQFKKFFGVVKKSMKNSSSLVELTDQELETKTGVFFNPKTGNAWELYIQDGKLMVKVPNFSFQISPSSKTRFRPANTLINLEIEFENLSQDKTLHMHIYAKGIKRATFILF